MVFQIKKRTNLQHVGFILTAGLSVILSILLFTSVSDSRLTWLLMASMAIAFEIGKWQSIHDGNRLLSSLLIAVSVIASAGGLSRAIDHSRLQNHQASTDRELILAEIYQNNQSIQRYIELNRIKRDAMPLQERNVQLREQLKQLPEPQVSEMTSLLSMLATLLALPLSWVKSAVVLLLAGLLDGLLWSLITSGLPVTTGSDDPDRLPLPDNHHEQQTIIQSSAAINGSDNVQAMADSYSSFRRFMLHRRDNGQDVMAQRAYVRESGIRERLVRTYYQRLVAEGVIEKVRGQYQWRSVQTNLFKAVP